MRRQTKWFSSEPSTVTLYHEARSITTTSNSIEYCEDVLKVLLQHGDTLYLEPGDAN